MAQAPFPIPAKKIIKQCRYKSVKAQAQAFLPPLKETLIVDQKHLVFAHLLLDQ